MKKTLLALILAGTGISAHAQQIDGWRRDGNGLYPEANPPLTWSREAIDPMVKGLRCQADKPKGEAAQGAMAIPKGTVRRWLAIGPFPTEGEADLEKDYLGGEASIQPSTGEKVGELEWKPFNIKNEKEIGGGFNYIFKRYGLYLNKVLGEKIKKKTCYAHTYIFSEKAGEAQLIIGHAGGLKIFLNGKEVYKSAKRVHARPQSGGGSFRTRRGKSQICPHIRVSLKKGWNRLLVKSFDGDGGKYHGSFYLSIVDRPDMKYKSENIRWITRLPDYGVGSPIVVGGRIFVSSEPDILVCLDKKTGKILWTRSTPIYAAVTQEERAQNPELKEIDPFVKELENPKTEYLEKATLRQKIKTVLLKIDKKYAWPSGKNLYANGYTFPTPVSDGEHVYVFYTTSIAACYDLNGNRKWIRNMIPKIANNPTKSKPNCSFNVSAPLIVDDKLILVRDYVAALDKSTGKILWKSKELSGHSVDKWHDKEKKMRYNINISATPLACRIAEEDVIICASAAVVRTRDGKVLSLGKPKQAGNPRAGFVWDKEQSVYFHSPHRLRVLEFGDKPEMSTIRNMEGTPPLLKRLTSKGTVGGKGWYATAFAAPLYHDGLIYHVSLDGGLCVLDARTGRGIYAKWLDLDPWLWAWTLGCCSSPTLGGKYIYIMDNQLNTIVIKPGREFKQVARNSMDNFLQRFRPQRQNDAPMTNPVFDGDCIYIRGETDLFCIGKDGE